MENTLIKGTNFCLRNCKLIKLEKESYTLSKNFILAHLNCLNEYDFHRNGEIVNVEKRGNALYPLQWCVKDGVLLDSIIVEDTLIEFEYY